MGANFWTVVYTKFVNWLLKLNPGLKCFVSLAAVDPPDDQNLTCITRDLSSVECHWNRGRQTYLDGIRKTIYTLNGRYPHSQQYIIHLNVQCKSWLLLSYDSYWVSLILNVLYLSEIVISINASYLRCQSRWQTGLWLPKIPLVWRLSRIQLTPHIGVKQIIYFNIDESLKILHGHSVYLWI